MAASFIGGGNQSTHRKPLTYRKSLTNLITYCCIEYILPWVGFKVTTLVVLNTDCTGSCKSNYHTITTITAQSIMSGIIYKEGFHCKIQTDFTFKLVFLDIGLPNVFSATRFIGSHTIIHHHKPLLSCCW
jgi:hypothetical protein